MNESISWDKSLETGIDEIDEQHKNIVKAINELCCSVSVNKSKKEIKKILEKLDVYVNNHFKTEENYMEKYNYDNILDHKDAHSYFIKTYGQIRYSYFYVDSKNLPKDEIINTYSLHLCLVLSDWIKLHFPTLDREFCDFIKNKIHK